MVRLRGRSGVGASLAGGPLRGPEVARQSADDAHDLPEAVRPSEHEHGNPLDLANAVQVDEDSDPGRSARNRCHIRAAGSPSEVALGQRLRYFVSVYMSLLNILSATSLQSAVVLVTGSKPTRGMDSPGSVITVSTTPTMSAGPTWTWKSHERSSYRSRSKR
jgi:hypothetical protein